MNVNFLKALMILLLFLQVGARLSPSAVASAPGNEPLRLDRAAFDAGAQNNGVSLKENESPRFDRAVFSTNAQNDPANPNSLPDGMVINIYEDSRRTLWMATFPTGLAAYDKDTRTFARYLDNIYSPGLYEDGPGNFWLGTVFPGALRLFDRETGKIIKSFTNDPANPASMGANMQVNVIVEDKFDPTLLWLATMGAGLERFDKKTETLTHYAHDPNNPNPNYPNEIGMNKYVPPVRVTTLKQGADPLNALLHLQVQRHAAELEQRVAERTDELRRMVNLMTGREARMAELKGVIRRLRAQLTAAGLTPAAEDPLAAGGQPTQ